VVEEEVAKLGVTGVEDETLVTESRRLPWEALLWAGTGIEGVLHPIGRQFRRPDTTSTDWIISSRNLIERIG
jgi:hypothetical protein